MAIVKLIVNLGAVMRLHLSLVLVHVRLQPDTTTTTRWRVPAGHRTGDSQLLCRGAETGSAESDGGDL
jgi:hypothetical protein